ncbi:TPA: hypothetical protein ACXGCQ_004717 [Escherichia coli]|uniref:hypothetical protein n=1 Tax=Escherichia coli TaxID=562 RepID=UPI001CCAB7C9|nr:hypothetical protein [Escherichia coli]MDM8858479.1 hypothetical protein [Escherichia coli]MDM8863435.1 hypothetical protein [Escherichia coli]MDM8868339.1 hypothetical protein [Escherichia coli]WJW18129.1 hypothetical protein QVM98_24125 [Escherichia coli]BDO97583.1 hypothetical protein TUM9812_46710 [Escherichia coli]
MTKSILKVVQSGDVPLEQNHYGGGGGDDMQARVAKLESDVEHIKHTLKEMKDDIREIKRDARSDFRLLFGAIISVALGLAALMAKGFHWL